MLNPFASIQTSLTTAVIVALATYGAWRTVEIEGLWFIHGYKERVAELTTTIETDRANYAYAQVQARADQLAANQATEAAYRHEAERADARYRIALAAAHSRAGAYADSHRVPRSCPAGSPPVITSRTPEDSPAPSGDSAGADAVVLSRGDFDTLTGNTIRLAQVKAWGDSLIQAELAIPSPAF